MTAAPSARSALLGRLVAPSGLLLAATLMSQDPPNSARVDVHSYARPEQVAVTHVSLDLSLDFEAKVASGACTLSLRRTDETAPLRLDCQGLQVAAIVDADGKELRWRALPPDPNLGSELQVDLGPGCAQVTIRYRTSPDAAAMQWLEPAQTSGDQPFLFTQGQAILTRSWIPLQDSPAVRVTWDARIQAPAGLVPLMSADERSGSAADGWSFRMTRPVPSYLIALACGELEERPISARCAVWAEPKVVDRAAAELADLERMVAACEELFGPYRWGRYDVLFLPASFPFGGMENPCMTFATPTILAGDKSLVALIAHELAHSWSGNLVTNATWRDFWLNEGFTVYLEQRIMAHVYGEERARMEIALSMRQLADELRSLPAADQKLHIDLAGRNPDDGMTGVPYDKGAALLRRLEQLVSRERFTAYLRGYFDEHAFTSITTADFLRHLRRELVTPGSDLEAALDLEEWSEGSGLPADAPTAVSQGFAEVDRIRGRMAETGDADALLAMPKPDWNTQQWLRLLSGLRLDAAQMARLDERFGLTATGNSEVLAVWLEAAIAADYAPAMPRLEQFLLQVGRRKFLKPLYEALCQTAAGKDRATAIYRSARPRYHAVAVRTLDQLLDWR